MRLTPLPPRSQLELGWPANDNVDDDNNDINDDNDNDDNGKNDGEENGDYDDDDIVIDDAAASFQLKPDWPGNFIHDVDCDDDGGDVDNQSSFGSRSLCRVKIGPGFVCNPEPR